MDMYGCNNNGDSAASVNNSSTIATNAAPAGNGVLAKRGRQVGGNDDSNVNSGGANSAVRIVPAPGAPANYAGYGMGLGGESCAFGAFGSGRSAGLEYAKLKKEEAREGFKEKRRRELVVMGEGDRTKRRRKNDTSMSENEKYRRRLKMNQDSAAAARYAQETYVSTLEDLVQKFEREKNKMSMDIGLLKNERLALERKITSLQAQLRVVPPRTVNDVRNMQAQGARAGNTRMQPTNPAKQITSANTAHQASVLMKQMSIMHPTQSTLNAPTLARASGAAASANNMMVDIPGLSEIASLPMDNMSSPTPNTAASELPGLTPDGTNLKKLTDSYDPSLMMNLDIDDSLDFSNDIIHMHPIA